MVSHRTKLWVQGLKRAQLVAGTTKLSVKLRETRGIGARDSASLLLVRFESIGGLFHGRDKRVLMLNRPFVVMLAQGGGPGLGRGVRHRFVRVVQRARDWTASIQTIRCARRLAAVLLAGH